MQEPNTIDKLELSIIKMEMDLRNARIELQNENLTTGESRAIHVEIEKIIFSLKTLNFIKND
jgi:hypothetical protein